MTDAVIVSTARTPIGKAYKGALNNTEGATMLGHAISAALSKANVVVSYRASAIRGKMVRCNAPRGLPASSETHEEPMVRYEKGQDLNTRNRNVEMASYAFCERGPMA